jgi:hypothetical protein
LRLHVSRSAAWQTWMSTQRAPAELPLSLALLLHCRRRSTRSAEPLLLLLLLLL